MVFRNGGSIPLTLAQFFYARVLRACTCRACVARLAQNMQILVRQSSVGENVRPCNALVTDTQAVVGAERGERQNSRGILPFISNRAGSTN
jgi:hypothetical protein